MSDADWLRLTIAGVGAIMIGPWVVWISKAAGNALSRSEHQALCVEREKRIDQALAEIKALINANNEDAVKSRHRLGNRITDLALRIAQLPGYNATARHQPGDADEN